MKKKRKTTFPMEHRTDFRVRKGSKNTFRYRILMQENQIDSYPNRMLCTGSIVLGVQLKSCKESEVKNLYYVKKFGS